MSKTVKRIGFLITGSEITQGEVMNTNSPKMAQLLQDFGMTCGEHLSCDDQDEMLQSALQFLMLRHQAIITIGGLGPTSDDLTRQAISKVTQRELQFNKSSWSRIQARLTQRNLPIPENNRQQAYFPEGAHIIPNLNGTADACILTINQKIIIMLPGPPKECLPLFQEHVIPLLKKKGFSSPLRLFRWRLLGASESAIAEQLTPIADTYQLHFAYCARYPFLDVKLMLDPHNRIHSKVLLQVELLLKPYFLTHLNTSMVTQLKEHLRQHPQLCSLEDEATHGYFERKFQTISPPSSLFLLDRGQAELHVKITGLQTFWADAPLPSSSVLDEFTVKITYQGKAYEFTSTVLLRGEETLEFVCEFTAWKVLQVL